ncbi:sigma-70 family RNA polymerase sigma factor [Candidatus Peregrinibacteria bacterium]|nr:sigma-70 family RNA polymerase sigma factor [Candidatus Peregrinibacteria bacterium]
MSSSDLKDRAEEIEALVEKIKKGDQNSYSALYDIFIDPIYRYVYFRVNKSDAEDLTETVFLKVWENIKKYKKGKASFSSWIFRIAHNLVVDYYRVNKNKLTSELTINIPDYKREHNPIKVTENLMHQDVLRAAINKLKKNYQEIIILKFINECSNSEISDMLKKSEGSLRILQHRALKALRKELKAMGINYDLE